MEDQTKHCFDGANLSSGTPTLFCYCGWSTEDAESWAEAGSQLDDHLEENQTNG